MNNNNNIAATIGIGAVGSILAYYGYTKLSENTYSVEKVENHIMDGTGIGNPNDLKKNVKKVADIVKDEVIKEINKTATPENKIDGKTWEKYWKTEYENSNDT